MNDAEHDDDEERLVDLRLGDEALPDAACPPVGFPPQLSYVRLDDFHLLVDVIPDQGTLYATKYAPLNSALALFHRAF